MGGLKFNNRQTTTKDGSGPQSEMFAPFAPALDNISLRRIWTMVSGPLTKLMSAISIVSVA